MTSNADGKPMPTETPKMALATTKGKKAVHLVDFGLSVSCWGGIKK